MIRVYVYEGETELIVTKDCPDLTAALAWIQAMGITREFMYTIRVVA